MLFKAIRIEDGLYELVSEYDDGLHLRKLGAGALISLCFSFLCGISSILCCKEEIIIFLHSCSMVYATSFVIAVFWSFALGFNRSRRFERSVTPFVVANVLSGIVAPTLFFVSTFILGNIIDYFTNHKIEAHLILTRFLPGLKYEVGMDSNDKACEQWVVADSLVLKIQKNESMRCLIPQRICNTYFNFCNSCLPNQSTILLSIIVVLTLMISFTYFIDISLVSQVTVSSCSDSSINIQYSCFKAGTLSPVSCTSNNGTQRLHCFRFFRFGVDVDIITASSSAFAFYLLTNRIFGAIILVIRMLHNFTYLHGALFMVGGSLLMFSTAIIGIMWISGYASDSVSLLAHLDVLNIAQLTMISLFIMIVGFLSHQGEWMQKRPAKHKLVMFEKK